MVCNIETNACRLADNNNLSGNLPPELSVLPKLRILYRLFALFIAFILT